jgi:hypothetical protein
MLSDIVKQGDVEIVFDENGDKLDFSVVSYGDILNEEEIQKFLIEVTEPQKL